MKKEGHPEYHPIVFIDSSTGVEFITRSTLKTKETRDVNGVEHFVYKCDITSASHPFYTGKQRLVDTEGRVDRFRRKYGK
ncbi:MAG: type B 50S ribosomal protein L31 [Myxococcota bacterium]